MAERAGTASLALLGLPWGAAARCAPHCSISACTPTGLCGLSPLQAFKAAWLLSSLTHLQVYKAVWLQFTDVAVKVMKEQQMEKANNDFLREVELVCR